MEDLTIFAGNENEKSLKNMTSAHFFNTADITIQVVSDLEIRKHTFDDKFEIFQVDEAGKDSILIHHHFGLLDASKLALGKNVYHKPPWSIYRGLDGWFYLGILSEKDEKNLWKMAAFNQDYSIGHIYHPNSFAWEQGNLSALTTFPSDQILIAQLLADRQGFYLHSAGVILDEAGVLFVGHAGAGKSTITKMLIANKTSTEQSTKTLKSEILCDDRNIVRKQSGQWWVYGSWSNGDVPLVSAKRAPLRAVFFLNKSQKNEILPVTNHNEIIKTMLPCIIKPYVTISWWQKTLDYLDQLLNDIPFYWLHFDKSSKIISALTKWTKEKAF